MSSLWGPEIAQDAYRIVDLAGVACNGILGARLARERRYDIVGLVILGVISALGGGIIRDVMLGITPIALTDPYYLSLALIGATLAYLWHFKGKWTNRFIVLADALCLGCWAATGVIKTLNVGLGVMPAILMGLITAVGGSIIRDSLAGVTPRVFGGNNLYATPALCSALIMVVFYKQNLQVVGMGVAIIVSLTFVLVAARLKLVLPAAPEYTVTLTSKQLRDLLRLRGIKIERLSVDSSLCARGHESEVTSSVAVRKKN